MELYQQNGNIIIAQADVINCIQMIKKMKKKSILDCAS